MLGEYCAAVASAVTNGVVQYGQAVIIATGVGVGTAASLFYRHRTKGKRYLKNGD